MFRLTRAQALINRMGFNSEGLNQFLFRLGQHQQSGRINIKPPGQLEFVLREGRKRQIRRMCELVDLSVRTLVRVRIGRVLLGQLRRSQWRHLANGEVF